MASNEHILINSLTVNQTWLLEHTLAISDRHRNWKMFYSSIHRFGNLLHGNKKKTIEKISIFSQFFEFQFHSQFIQMYKVYNKNKYFHWIFTLHRAIVKRRKKTRTFELHFSHFISLSSKFPNKLFYCLHQIWLKENSKIRKNLLHCDTWQMWHKDFNKIKIYFKGILNGVLQHQ